jgi:hypothetical protein
MGGESSVFHGYLDILCYSLMACFTRKNHFMDVLIHYVFVT